MRRRRRIAAWDMTIVDGVDVVAGDGKGRMIDLESESGGRSAGRSTMMS